MLQVGLPVSRAAQQAAATCLGLLGAVDPARVPLPLPPSNSLVASDLTLLTELIQRHLVRVLRVASHLFQLDAATFALQVGNAPFRLMCSCLLCMQGERVLVTDLQCRSPTCDRHRCLRRSCCGITAAPACRPCRTLLSWMRRLGVPAAVATQLKATPCLRRCHQTSRCVFGA